MSRVNTRIKSKVDAIPGAELFCNTHQEWKPAADFHYRLRETSIRAQRYFNKCRECTKIATQLRKTNGRGVLANHHEIMVFLAEGKAVAPVVKLNAAAHPASTQSVKLKPLSGRTKRELEQRRKEREEQEGPEICYLIGMEGDDKAVKVGFTNDIAKRLKQNQTGNPRKLIVLGTLPGGRETEQRIHQKYAATQGEFVGEWFMKSPGLLNEFRVTAKAA